MLNTITARRRRRIRLFGDNVPSVDVMITACNEPLDVVQDTIRAALALDYPSHRYRVIISDDGADERLRKWTQELVRACHKTHVPLYYTSRQKQGPAGYKAGNLNHAIRHADFLPQGTAEFVAGLDADMIPARHWLRTVAAHMVQDPYLGVVCPPQHFYNFPENDPLNQSLWVRGGAGISSGICAVWPGIAALVGLRGDRRFVRLVGFQLIVWWKMLAVLY